MVALSCRQMMLKDLCEVYLEVTRLAADPDAYKHPDIDQTLFYLGYRIEKFDDFVKDGIDDEELKSKYTYFAGMTNNILSQVTLDVQKWQNR